MTIRDSIYFSYDGIYSKDMGIVNVNVESQGMLEEQFLFNRSILEQKIKGNPKPYFQGVQEESLVFNVQFAFLDKWDEQKIRKVCRWLLQPYYKPLYFSSNINRIFYAMVVNDSTLVHNGLKQGYIELTFRCDSPYTYSPNYTKSFDCSSNIIDGIEIVFENIGDITLKPEMWITKIDNGDISIINKSFGNREFKFIDLLDGEIVYVDNKNEHIETNQINIFRYDNFNNNYLELVHGVNKLQVYGKCLINLRYEFETLNG